MSFSEEEESTIPFLYSTATKVCVHTSEAVVISDLCVWWQKRRYCIMDLKLMKSYFFKRHRLTSCLSLSFEKGWKT